MSYHPTPAHDAVAQQHKQAANETDALDRHALEAEVVRLQAEVERLLRGSRCPQCSATEWNEASSLRARLAAVAGVLDRVICRACGGTGNGYAKLPDGRAMETDCSDCDGSGGEWWAIDDAIHRGDPVRSPRQDVITLGAVVRDLQRALSVDAVAHDAEARGVEVAEAFAAHLNELSDRFGDDLPEGFDAGYERAIDEVLVNLRYYVDGRLLRHDAEAVES